MNVDPSIYREGRHKKRSLIIGPHKSIENTAYNVTQPVFFVPEEKKKEFFYNAAYRTIRI